jgi:dihydroorotase
VVDPAALSTAGRNSPLRGRELPGRVIATFFGGHPTVLDGAVHAPREQRVGR